MERLKPVNKHRYQRKCRVCGCTWFNACITEQGSCHWVEEDLCSACVTVPDASTRAGHPEPVEGQTAHHELVEGQTKTHHSK